MVWYSHFLKNFLQFVVIHTVKGFSIINEADVFLEFPCFYDPEDVGNLISGSSAFSKSSLNIWKFSVHICWSLAWRILSITLLVCSFQFSRSVVSNSLQPHESQHARPPCPSPTPGVYSNSCPSSWWRHPAISSSVVPFASCPQSLPTSGSFPVSQLFTWSSQNIGVSASASVLPMNTQGWTPLGWTGWISLQSKGPREAHFSKMLFGGYICRGVDNVNDHLLILVWKINLLLF